MPAICKAQTTKQAKASFKARGRPSLSDQEQRQLARTIELEERAERSKEAEKRRAEAARKRTEKERREKIERDRNQLLSQRRCDKFGFKASQFHLGAFFGKPKGEAADVQNVVDAPLSKDEEDAFGDDGLEDEELLQALEIPSGKKQQPGPDSEPKSDSALMPPPLRPQATSLRRSDTDLAPAADQDLGNFWDELESSTQIARELEYVSPEKEQQSQNRVGSFNSEDFDFTAEDLDELDPPPKSATPAPAPAKAQRVMAPPAVPVKQAAKQMPPPAIPAKRVQNKVKTQNAIRGPFLPASSLYCSPDLGFTLTQLGEFVEDDLQLTQAVPG